jgi:hypothetical protein
VACVAQRLDGLGEQDRLADGRGLGVKPCCLAWFQKVVKSGGIGTPVTISTLPCLKAFICAEKSSVRF